MRLCGPIIQTITPFRNDLSHILESYRSVKCCILRNIVEHVSMILPRRLVKEEILQMTHLQIILHLEPERNEMMVCGPKTTCIWSPGTCGALVLFLPCVYLLFIPGGCTNSSYCKTCRVLENEHLFEELGKSSPQRW